MKRIIMSACALLSVAAAYSQEKETKDSFYTLAPAEVRAVRAGENTPFTKTNLSKKEIAMNNLGQDIPYLLNQTPAVVVNSDAGNGVGYTGIRIRGTDATRINVTLNGIPYNDAESQGTFFVDLPDFSSSASSIQVQRGVGTSSNGAGAFGASINFSTNEVNRQSYAELNNSFGSFNTWKNTVKAGTGLLDDHFTADIRLSRISSDGFIDRATSNLQSLYFSTAWMNKKTSLRFNLFSGKEKTYQAWYGISQADLDAGNRTVNYAGTEKSGDPYDNETDNYTQTHYQLFFNHSINNRFSFNTACFLTKGKGYYEQYKADEAYADYGLPGPVVNGLPVSHTDLVRRLWLDNNYYGNIFSLQYRTQNTQATFGGAITRYDGNHYGDIIWASSGIPVPVYRWYDLDAKKTDLTLYIKQQTKLAGYWHGFYDLQYRHVHYNLLGFRDNPGITANTLYDFFNPKAGISYGRNGWKAYGSFAIAHKEPNRDDFESSPGQRPKPESLYDVEAGIEKTKERCNWSATFYYMRYKDQLVLTGQINDVGAYTRTNIPESFRAGIELQGGMKMNGWMNASANLSLSRNKVRNFTEYIDDYDNGGQKTNHFHSPDIAFSPAVVAAAAINFIPLKGLEISLPAKYVSRQYLDNTGNDFRSLRAFYVQDLRTRITLRGKHWKEMSIIGQLNNVFGRKYEPNGYTYSYFAGGETVTENYYFPMAGVNVMLALNLKF